MRGQKSLLFPSAAEMVVGGRFSQDSAQLRLTVFADNVKFTVTAMCYWCVLIKKTGSVSVITQLCPFNSEQSDNSLFKQEE